MRYVKACLVMLVVVSGVFAGTVNLLGGVRRAVEPTVTLAESSTAGIVIEVSIPAFDSEEIEVDIGRGVSETFDKISIPGCGLYGAEGDPALPLVSVLIALPDNAVVGSPVIDIINDETFGDYYVYPRESFYFSETGIEAPRFVYNNALDDVYSQNGLYPSEVLVEVEDRGYFYSQRLAAVSFCPIQFNPQTEELYVVSEVEIELPLTAEPGKTITWNDTPVGPFHEDLQRLCLNYNFDDGIPDPVTPNPTSSGSLYYFDPAWTDQQLGEQKVDYLVILAAGFEGMLDGSNPGAAHDGYLDELLRWRSIDADSPDDFDVMVARLDDIIPYMSSVMPPLQRTACTNLRCGHLLDQFIEKVYELTSADHIPGGKLLYLLLVGDAHIDSVMGDGGPDYHGDDHEYDIRTYTMNDTDEFYGYAIRPEPEYDIPSVMYDREKNNSWTFELGLFCYPTYTDQPYADIHDGDFYSRFDYNYPGTNDAHDEYVPIFTADPAVSYPELLVGRLTADNTLVNDDETGDNRDALEVMSDICRKIYDFEANPPSTPPGNNYRRDVCIYDGTRDTTKDGNPPNPATWEGRRKILWYTQRDDMYWDQLGFDVHYQIAWNHTDQEIIDNELTDEVVDLFEAGSSVRLGEYIFIYQNHGGPFGWGSTRVPNGEGEEYIPFNVIGLDEVDDLDNGPYYPQVFQLCCSTGRYFEHLAEDRGDEISDDMDYNPRISGPDDNRNICEVLLRDPDGGALAVYGASIATHRGFNAKAVCHIAELRETERLGRLVLNLGFRRGFNEFQAYHLFGDPALHITDQWRDAGKPDLAVIWDRAWIDRYPTSGANGSIPVYVRVKNLGDAASVQAQATFTYYSKPLTSNIVTQVGTDSVTVPALDPGETALLTAEYEFPAGIDNGQWLDVSDVPMTFFFQCEVDPGDSIDESDEDNNTITWADDNAVSYPAVEFNDYWLGNPLQYFEVDDIAEDPCEPSEVWFFPNAANFPDRLNAVSSLGETLPYVVVAELSTGDTKGMVVLGGVPYLIDENGIDTATTFTGLSDEPITALAVGELDGDSSKEIVGVSSQKVYAWNPDGSAVNGWPVTALEGGYSFGDQLVLADVDNDTRDEVAVIDHDNGLPSSTDWNAVLLDNTGTQTPIWRKDIDDEDTTAVLITAGNLNGTAGSEIMVSRLYYVYEGGGGHGHTATYCDLFAWDSMGNNVLAYTCYTIPKYHCDYPLVCDYDDDGTVELLVTALDGLVDKVGYAYNAGSSSPETGNNAFKAELAGNQQWPWVAANVTGGGGTKPEFFCGVENSILMTAEQFPYNEKTENQYYYEPESVDLDCTYSPVIADFDPLLDSKPDIAFGCIDGYVFFGPTNPQDEDDVTDLFPTGLRFYTDPRLGLPTEYIRHLSMADLDGDGDYELIGTTNLSRVFVWETGCTDSADIHWEQYLHDVGHTNYSDDW
jgi:hypothetical protein